MRLRRNHFLGLVLSLALAAAPSFAANKGLDTLPAGKAGIVTISAPTWVGQRLLPAGAYEFRCAHKGNSHLMTVRRVRLDARGGGPDIGKYVAVAYCRMELLPDRVKLSSALITKDPAGSRTLDELRVQGEYVRHVFDQTVLLEPVDIN